MPKLRYIGGTHADPRWPQTDHEEADEELVRLKLLSGCFEIDDDESSARRGRARFTYTNTRDRRAS